ncbi:MAG TPA: multifunctional oxoglutarate decarboxylase/oxoglutarate dehydrogenase thiamine pyrophosphate-binding subunit/dihydrolipoyllysine-residue succinyltransferase subunit, partial [Mycobacterium sp.]|nr:multifunctional oxoglutarate decarboxylase/oxoglutarate dehydrogenase thiamine pyrophosphate-binding subunit/dihydrolipoyllysine-residue succinyltransferase subunit [Mycobacterium sp.]
MSSTSSPFGQNEWLVEEMYRKFRDDPSSVDPSWHEFLVDYKPEPSDGQPAAPARPQPAAAPAAAPAATPAAQPVAPPASKPAAQAPTKPEIKPDGDAQVLRGAAAAVVRNMSASLEVPTATSVRAIPAKLMIDNRTV